MLVYLIQFLAVQRFFTQAAVVVLPPFPPVLMVLAVMVAVVVEQITGKQVQYREPLIQAAVVVLADRLLAVLE